MGVELQAKPMREVICVDLYCPNTRRFESSIDWFGQVADSGCQSIMSNLPSARAWLD